MVVKKAPPRITAQRCANHMFLYSANAYHWMCCILQPACSNFQIQTSDFQMSMKAMHCLFNTSLFANSSSPTSTSKDKKRALFLCPEIHLQREQNLIVILKMTRLQSPPQLRCPRMPRFSPTNHHLLIPVSREALGQCSLTLPSLPLIQSTTARPGPCRKTSYLGLFLDTEIRLMRALGEPTVKGQGRDRVSFLGRG